MIQLPTADMKVPSWHHVKCVFKKCIILDISQIKGTEKLRPADQTMLKEMINKHSPLATTTNSEPTPTSKKNKKQAKKEEDVEMEDTTTKKGKNKKGKRKQDEGIFINGSCSHVRQKLCFEKICHYKHIFCCFFSCDIVYVLCV